MRTHLLPLIALLTVLLAPAAAQSRRLQFENSAAGATIAASGVLHLRVGQDPFRRPRWVRYGIRIDGALVDTTDHLPWEYAWDTTAADDGTHEVRLVLIDGRTKADTATDVLNVKVQNRAAPPAPKSAEPKPAVSDRSRPTTPRQNPDNPDDTPGFEPVRPAQPDTGLQPVEGGTSRYTLAPTRPSAPLAEAATALCLAGGELLIGHANGGLTLYDIARHTGKRLTPPVAADDTLYITRGDGALWWVTRSGQTLFCYREKEGTLDVTRFPRPVRPTGFATLRGPVLIGDGAAFRPDLDHGLWMPATDLMPPGVAGAEVLAAGAGGQGGLRLVLRSGSSLALWETDAAGEWPAAPRATAPAPAPGQNERWRVASGAPVAMLGLQLVDLAAAAPGFVSLDACPEAAAPFRWSQEMAAAGGHVWWTGVNGVLHAMLAKGKLEAYVPWNGAFMDAQCLVAQGDSVWIGGRQGVRRLSAGPVQKASGYSGFVRVPLDAASTTPPGAREEKLLKLVEEWQGVPYLWGGSTKKGTDCSGFVMAVYRDLGISLPHGTAYLPTAGGLTVHDELRYGDVLVYPGHCALYLGGGRTAETVASHVGKGTIWGRTQVVVKRFLNVSTPKRLASRKPTRRG